MMQTKTRWAMVLGWGLLAGCAGIAVPPGLRGEPSHAVRPGEAVLSIRLQSDVADPYYVLTGPAETYRAYRVTERFRRHLEGYAAQKSAAEGPRLELSVTLESLSTGYQQIGGADRGGKGRLARLSGKMPVQVAAAGPWARLGILGRFSGLEGDGGDLSIPYEITKRATLTARVEVSSAGRTLARETVTVQGEEIIRWENYDAWAYDYARVFEAAFRKLIAEVDGLVDRAVAGLGR